MTSKHANLYMLDNSQQLMSCMVHWIIIHWFDPSSDLPWFQQLIALYSHFILPMLTMFVVAYTTYSLFCFADQQIHSLNTYELHNEQYQQKYVLKTCKVAGNCEDWELFFTKISKFRISIHTNNSFYQFPDFSEIFIFCVLPF